MEIPSDSTENVIRFTPSDSIENLVARINDIRKQCGSVCLEKKASHARSATAVAKNSIWQNLEQDLRKCVGELVSEVKSKELAVASSAAKKQIITEFRASNRKEWDCLDLKSLLRSKLNDKGFKC